ncbi:hypothetical protein [Listeria seeligeri]|uniref:hypothetical protein n=1 Tax=Listeria seeligeri TaxID=1640 RepID=UPI0016296B58|nr:hypothetical protein [Listeria seeligeri]MBC1537433.1 hypothetical protein [Listeria seeligeri]MBC1555336.1 hypothetical protein [Listeria seeligeri]MBC6122011.1 hypothetical protein [Listeria seeligeri]
MSISHSYNSKGKNGEVTSFAMTMDKKGVSGSLENGVTSVTGLSDMYIYSDSDTDIPWEDMPVKEILEALGYSVVGSIAIIGLAMDDATGVLVADDVLIPVAAKEIMKSWVRVGAACAVK